MFKDNYFWNCSWAHAEIAMTEACILLMKCHLRVQRSWASNNSFQPCPCSDSVNHLIILCTLDNGEFSGVFRLYIEIFFFFFLNSLHNCTGTFCTSSQFISYFLRIGIVIKVSLTQKNNIYPSLINYIHLKKIRYFVLSTNVFWRSLSVAVYSFFPSMPTSPCKMSKKYISLLQNQFRGKMHYSELKHAAITGVCTLIICL